MILDKKPGRYKHHGIEYDATGKSGKYKYRLARDYKFKLSIFLVPFETAYLKVDKQGYCTAYIGYAWDGPSGPSLDTDSFMRGSLEHDIWYQLIRERIWKRKKNTNPKWWKKSVVEKYRKKADEELRLNCIKDGMSKFRARYVYWAVRLFGAFAIYI